MSLLFPMFLILLTCNGWFLNIYWFFNTAWNVITWEGTCKLCFVALWYASFITDVKFPMVMHWKDSSINLDCCSSKLFVWSCESLPYNFHQSHQSAHFYLFLSGKLHQIQGEVYLIICPIIFDEIPKPPNYDIYLNTGSDAPVSLGCKIVL